MLFLQAFMVGVWNFELYMLPLTLIMLFIWNLMVREIKGTSAADDMVYFVSVFSTELRLLRKHNSMLVFSLRFSLCYLDMFSV